MIFPLEDTLGTCEPSGKTGLNVMFAEALSWHLKPRGPISKHQQVLIQTLMGDDPERIISKKKNIAQRRHGSSYEVPFKSYYIL